MSDLTGRSGPVTSLEIRHRIVKAVQLDLVGPWPDHPLENEKLPGWVRPSNWYLTGFLIPVGASREQRSDSEEDDELDEVPTSAGLVEESAEEGKSAKRSFFPSSMGISFLVDAESENVQVTVRWGDYEYRQDDVTTADGKPLPVWQRTQRSIVVDVPIAAREEPDSLPVPGSGGLLLTVVCRQTGGGIAELPAGTRSVSIFLVNERPPTEDADGGPDSSMVFQPELTVRGTRPFVPRPDPRGSKAAEWDDRVADLHYADTPEYAAGHGVSAEWEMTDAACHVLRTTWLPTADVEKTTTQEILGLDFSMRRLGALRDADAVRAGLSPLVGSYRQWIAAQTRKLDGIPSQNRRETAQELVRLAGVAANRIERGIEALAGDPDALDAFRVANRAVAEALRARLKIEEPEWRPFQLAFILLNIPGIADPTDSERRIVDLLFFPTGGGKTEAYLGLAAFTLVLRRLRNPEDNGKGGAGVSVIMRYTLRLLTLDQLSRAAGLVCALELERERQPDRFGEWPFEIGLWVGKASTPNRIGHKGEKGSDSARAKVRRFRANPRGNPSPIPLENCPWCGTEFVPDSFELRPDEDHPKELRVVCTNIECDFVRDRPLPIVAVDDPLYRRLPAFLIATVDKFAALPWTGPCGVLLGGAERFDGSGFYGPAEPGRGSRLSRPLPPPDLVIQDELHLIAGPLGTMMGLYETALESLSVRESNGQDVRPKIVASTATVRQARDQIQALFGRGLTQVFPPPGPDRRDSFFARVVPATEVPARLYLGVASKGRNPKVLMRRTLLAVMGAAEQAYRDAGGHQRPDNPADPYMTMLGYFNSLRELGGARRILEEEVQHNLRSIGRERRRIGEAAGMLQDRVTKFDVVELTSRVNTDQVAQARSRLEATFDQRDRVDYAIATNMISVGLDIPRLGLMVVLGQPKTHAEYIQATSRVGRDDDKPGLVLTLLNVHKPRDRSHYERFRHYHETFYRAVEVPSVTPFSARALDRGFAGGLVGLSRHARAELTPPDGVNRIQNARGDLEPLLLETFEERVRQQPIRDEAEREERLQSVRSRVVDLLDSWVRIIRGYHDAGVQCQYQRYEGGRGKPLLREMLDHDFDSPHHRKFRANRSLRDVEPQVNVVIQDLSGRVEEDE